MDGPGMLPQSNNLVHVTDAEPQAPGSSDNTELLRVPGARRVCGVCIRAAARYSCPRCLVPYCGLDCYKPHSSTCTEAFYAAQVKAELTSREQERAAEAPARQAAMQQLLLRFEQTQLQDAEDAKDAADLAALQDLAQREHVDESDLTPLQRESFLRFLRDGSASRVLEPRSPWWTRPVLQDADDAGVPAAPSVSPRAAAAIAARPPSPLVAHAVLQTVYAYVCVMRRFNCDWRADPALAAACLASAVPCLVAAAAAVPPASALLAIQTVSTALASPPCCMPVPVVRAAVADALAVASARPQRRVVVRLLADVECMLQDHVPSSVLRKVHYYIAWAQDPRRLQTLADLLVQLHRQYLDES